jgi:hypothetical protein
MDATLQKDFRLPIADCQLPVLVSRSEFRVPSR